MVEFQKISVAKWDIGKLRNAKNSPTTASEYVLGGVIPECNYHAWIMMVRIVELVFSCCRKGWDTLSLQLLFGGIKSC